MTDLVTYLRSLLLDITEAENLKEAQSSAWKGLKAIDNAEDQERRQLKLFPEIKE